MRDQKVFLSSGVIDYRLAGLELRDVRRQNNDKGQTKSNTKPEHLLETYCDNPSWTTRCICGWSTTRNETNAIALDKGFGHVQVKRPRTFVKHQDRAHRQAAVSHILQLHRDQERWHAACRCGWTSLPSRRASLALSNGQDHVRRAR